MIALAETADLERRFGGLKRLYGEAGYSRLRAAHVAVVGVGGVGSWAAEALARSGVARLSLIDLDHVAESNVNRQVQALGATLGMAKVLALRERIADIHPGCAVQAIEAFVEDGAWPGLLPAAGGNPDVVIDACDDARAKRLLANWALAELQRLVICGAAGGKRQAHAVAVADLADVTHDPLLARLRQHLRREHGLGTGKRFGLSCVYSKESVQRPAGDGAVEGGLHCAGYGSSVTVTASFGMSAAGQAISLLLESKAFPGC